MNDQAQTTDLLLLRRDADGIAWLTLNRPSARNALSLGLMRVLVAELRGDRCRYFGEGRRNWWRRPGVLRRPRPARAPRQPRSRGLRGDVPALLATDDRDRAVAAAGDCPRTRPGHGGRLPACGGLRLGCGGRGSRVRHAGREDRPVLHHADGAVGALDSRPGQP